MVPKTEESARSPGLDDILTTKELAEWLGVSEDTVRTFRDLPFARVGRRRIYFKQSVARWLADREMREP